MTIIEATDGVPATQIPQHVADVGGGWSAILLAAHVDLLGVDADYRVLQVKEKFGELRVYLVVPSGRFGEVEQVVERACARSRKTCEYCGAPGYARHDMFWIKTLCDGCAAKRLAQRAAGWPDGGSAAG